jgi:hypothetical protein
MKQAYEDRIVVLTQPNAIVDNAAFNVAELDTLGWEEVSVYFIIGALDIAPTVMKITETDTTGSGYSDIPASVFGAVGNPALPLATDDNKVYCVRINKINRKRFIKPALASGDGATGTYATVIAILSRPQVAPLTPAGRGLAAEVLI